MSTLKYLGQHYDFDENYNNYCDSYTFLMYSKKKKRFQAPTGKDVCEQFAEWCYKLDRFTEIGVEDFTETLSKEQEEDFLNSITNKAQVIHNIAADFDCYFTVDNTLIRSAEQKQETIDLEMYHPKTK